MASSNSLKKMAEMRAFDEEMRKMHPLLCGVDEAGRGPLCGPVSVAAVILDPDDMIFELNDSKKISEKKREVIYEEIVEKAIAWQVVLIPPSRIDEINILWATMEGMLQAVESLQVKPDYVLIDGDRLPEISIKGEAITKGDATSASVAAASIIAKVTRDRYMREIDVQYPEYQFAKHKGYPTKLHYELLMQHGVLPFYRRSFLKKRGIK